MMIKLQKWHCVSTVEFEDECDTTFYVEGEYFLNPNCPECGRDKAVECLGVIEFIEAKEKSYSDGLDYKRNIQKGGNQNEKIL